MELDMREYVAREYEDIKSFVENNGLNRKLCILQVGNNEASNIYVRNKIKKLEYVGIEVEHIKYSDNVSKKELIYNIIELNKDNSVDGIFLQLPLPDKLRGVEDELINTIDSRKDIDGLTYDNLGRLYTDQQYFKPCTAQGVLDILNYSKEDLEGKNVLIIGRSILVGKPLFQMLTNANATVTLAHSKTKNLKNLTKNADIIIVAIGRPLSIGKDYFREDNTQTVIDVGINRLDNGSIVGDVDYKNVKDIVKNITPVPRGVGLMTVLNVVKNVVYK